MRSSELSDREYFDIYIATVRSLAALIDITHHRGAWRPGAGPAGRPQAPTIEVGRRDVESIAVQVSAAIYYSSILTILYRLVPRNLATVTVLLASGLYISALRYIRNANSLLPAGIVQHATDASLTLSPRASLGDTSPCDGPSAIESSSW